MSKNFKWLNLRFSNGPIRQEVQAYPKTVINKKQRSFQHKWFIDRPWLEYNRSKDAALCFPCRVFGLRKQDQKFSDEGYRDWEKALSKGKGFHKHSTSGQHLANMENWMQWKSSIAIDVQLDEQQKKNIEQFNQDKKSRRDVLPMLFDVSNTLSRLRLPFRGHDESMCSSNRGVFLEMVHLLGRWNEKLETHLKKSEQNAKAWPSYTSPNSQNEMIHSSAEILRNSIVKEVKDAVYFAICLDTTPDAGKNDQLSMILRFVKKEGDVVEALLDLSHVKKADSESLYAQLCRLLKEYDLNIEHLRGQGYDGCATMAGHYSGLQARVREACPEAYFVHCYAHRLNLVVVDTCTKNVDARNFFGILQKLYVFIENSTKRHGLFQDIKRDEMLSDEGVAQKGGNLTSLSATRWCARAQNCTVLSKNIVSVVRTLTAISTDASYDTETAANAIALHKCIDFKFCLCLTVFSEILKLCNIASKSLQSPKVDISAAVSLVETLILEIEAQRTDEKFSEFWRFATNMADKIDVEPMVPRRKKVSTRIDENVENQTFFTFEDECRITFFFEVIDLMLCAVRSRFSIEMNPLLKSLKALSYPSPENMTDIQILADFYSRDVDKEVLITEYRLFARGLDETIPNSIHDILLHMVKTRKSELFPNLFKLYRLTLTLPVTSSSCERSFSALKFVKNHLRTTMTQNRLNDLMIIAVESERSKKLSLDACADFFWDSLNIQRR